MKAAARETLADRFADFIDEQRAIRRPKPRSPKTIAQLKTNIGNFLKWAADQKPVVQYADQLTDQTLDAFADWLATRPADNRSGKLTADAQRTYCRNVRQFQRWLGTAGSKFRLPEIPRKAWEGKLPTRKEIDAMIEAAGNPRDRLIVRLLADTGVRLGELLSLTKARIIANAKDERYAIRVHGKTGERIVPILPKLYRELRRYADGQDDDSAPIFVTNRRRKSGEYEPLTSRGVQQAVRQAAIIAGIPNPERIHPHLFRHAIASHLLDKGQPPLRVQALLGHKSLATLSIYGHGDEDSVRESLREVLGG